MFNKINKNGAKTAFTSNTNLYQKFDTIGGLPVTLELQKALDIKLYEILSVAEVEKLLSLTNHEQYGEYVSSALYGNEQDDSLNVIKPILDFIHSKRFFGFQDINGIKRIVAIPSNREIGTGFCPFSRELVRIALAYSDYLKSSDKVASYASFTKRINYLQSMIASRLFSKEFKRKIDFSFNGLCGVALTGNVSFDGIELPHWYCKKHSLKIGDTCLVLRDPVQNIFIALKIEGFTHNEIRVNSQTITVIDGDFDGDGLSVIPMSMLRAECEARGVKTEVIAQIESELNDLVPTKLLSNPDFSRLVRDYSL